MINNPKYHYYRDLIISTQRGNYRGHVSNAKPVFMLSIIDAISANVINKNRLFRGEVRFVNIYKYNCKLYNNHTPIDTPFFHLTSSGYFHIKWIHEFTGSRRHTPSTKFLNENIEYAYLDNALWDLLQDEQTRMQLKADIINFFIDS